MSALIQEIEKLSQIEYFTLNEGLEEKWRRCKTNERDEFYQDLSDALYARCATDIEIFSRVYFSHYCTIPFNGFHFDTFNDYQYGERHVRRASAAPRGYAKSTIKALIKPIHDLCYKLEKFIVIGSNTLSQSVQKLKDIQAEFITNEMLISDYGELIQGRKAGAEDFVAANGNHKCRFLAVGSGTEIRGIRFGDARPTKIILDDVEHSTEVENEAIRDKMLAWYNDVIAKIGDEKTNIEFVGTVLHRKSLLKYLVNNPIYQSREYKAIESWAENKGLWDQWTKIYTDLDNDNRGNDALEFYQANLDEMMRGVKVLWPEKEPYYALQLEIIETGLRSFMKEKQNSPMSDEEKVFDPADFQYFTEEYEGLRIESNKNLIPWAHLVPFAAIDPATGQQKASARKKSDFTCILVGYKDTKGRLYVVEDYTARVSPTKFIKKIFMLFFKHEFQKMGVETNLFRNLLLANILDEKRRMEKQEKKKINVKFYDIVQTENKEKRIFTLEPKVAHGKILFSRSLSREFYDQMWEFPKGQHDDCCFVSGTKVHMITGLVEIQNIKIGDIVITPFGYRKVLNTGSRMQTVVTNLNLTGTKNHPIFTLKNGFMRLDTVELPMLLSLFKLKEVIRWRYKKLLNSMVLNIEEWEGKETITSLNQLQIKGGSLQKDFMLQSGNFIQKKQFLKVGLFIIKTAIVLITSFLTLNVFHAQNIRNIIQQKIQPKNIWIVLGILLKSGTDQKKAKNGMFNMEIMFSEILQSIKKYVKLALLNMKQRGLKNQDFAHQNVETKNILMRESVVKFENAEHAVQTSEHSSIKTLKAVAGNAQKQRVYNLTVEEDHVYYANGILVANCDTLEQLYGLVNNRYKPSSMNKSAQDR